MTISHDFEEPTQPISSWCLQLEHPLKKSQILLDDHYGVAVEYGQPIIGILLGFASKWLVESKLEGTIDPKGEYTVKIGEKRALNISPPPFPQQPSPNLSAGQGAEEVGTFRQLGKG